MKASKIITTSILSFFLVGITFFNAFATDIPKKESFKDEKKQGSTLAYSQEEVKFIAEMDAYYVKKYSNPMEKIQIKTEKIIVVDALGNTLKQISVTDHQEHDALLPIGAEKLMVKGNTAYYILF